MKLQIGGKSHVDGWHNLDIEARPDVDIVANADSIPLDDGSVKEIYASHVLEHFGYFKLQNVLTEWRRVLCSGGLLSLSVPDLDTLCKLYLEFAGDPPLQFHIMRIIYGGQTNQHDYHFAGLNLETLVMFLDAAGFGEIVRVNAFDGWNDSSRVKVAERQISLNVRAVAGKSY